MRATVLIRLLGIGVAIALIAGCGGGGAAPTTRPGGAASPGASPSIGGIFPFSFPPSTPWPPVGGKARVVNLYRPGIEPPYALEVVQQGFASTSAPLLTVQPGTASDYFDPGDEGNGSTDLGFYRAGAARSGNQIMAQGWNKMKGRQITIVVFNSGSTVNDPNASASPAVRANGAAYVVEERGGDNPRATPEAGKGLLWMDSQPLSEIPSAKGWVSPAVGTGDGSCLLAKGDSAGGGYSFLFGQQAFSLPPGPVKLYIYDPISNQGECTGTPVYGPIEATVAAGQQSVAILYGPDNEHIQTLLLPIGS